MSEFLSGTANQTRQHPSKNALQGLARQVCSARNDPRSSTERAVGALGRASKIVGSRSVMTQTSTCLRSPRLRERELLLLSRPQAAAEAHEPRVPPLRPPA
jgi:hypothetical protein